ncbi:hypothetical protein Q8A67_020276 [Cirrhinus molitorella]|uniref:Uncharacterized protein n=1 Tax=Cirrhinus molitorella TaxID=172907 RepID=A0AA88PA09_9TELE|nr:hypothetical protein Q8A67_020276 [Cirrhinus molitorella]
MYCKLDPGQAPRPLPSPPLGRVALKECDDWDGKQSPAFMHSRQELWLCDSSQSVLSDMCGAFCLSVLDIHLTISFLCLSAYNLVYLELLSQSVVKRSHPVSAFIVICRSPKFCTQVRDYTCQRCTDCTHVRERFVRVTDEIQTQGKRWLTD